MDTETELKSIRYLLNDVILYLYDIGIRLDEIHPSKKEYKIHEPNVNGDSIKFDLFTIPKKRYTELVDVYGIDTVNRACVRLDDFIRINEYIPYRTAYNSLKNKFIKDILFEKIKEKETPSHLDGLESEEIN